MAGAWLDISMPLEEGMPTWPGEPPFRSQPVQEGPAFTSLLTLGSHAGTHLDAPRHFVPAGAGAETATFEALNGDAVVIDATDVPAALAAVAAMAAPERQRILLRGSPGLSPGTADMLARLRPRLVGIDRLSIAAFDAAQVHKTLFASGVWILEGLRLRDVPAGPGDLACLPLLLPGLDGSPARAFFRPRRKAL